VIDIVTTLTATVNIATRAVHKSESFAAGGDNKSLHKQCQFPLTFSTHFDSSSYECKRLLFGWKAPGPIRATSSRAVLPSTWCVRHSICSCIQYGTWVFQREPLSNADAYGWKLMSWCHHVSILLVPSPVGLARNLCRMSQGTNVDPF
jgi:hypothetical protein